MTQERSAIHSLEMRCTQCNEALLVELDPQENAIMVAPCWGCINEKVNDAEAMQEVYENLQKFGVSTWCHADIEQLLAEKELSLAPSEIEEIAKAADGKISEAQTAAGWEILNYFIDEHLEKKEAK